MAMPIPNAIRTKYYGAHWRNVVRIAALERAGYRCQRCGLADGAVGYRTGALFHPVPARRRRGRDLVTIHLQVCHLNDTPGDDRAENLVVKCPRCHLVGDSVLHRESRAARKDRGRPLLTMAEAQMEELHVLMETL
jgi:hypothetical protein